MNNCERYAGSTFEERELLVIDGNEQCDFILVGLDQVRKSPTVGLSLRH